MIHTAKSTGKFRKLLRWLRGQLPSCPVDYETIAVGLLEQMWHYTIASHRRGDIGESDNELIAEAMGWHGDADELVRQLVETKWLIEHPQHRLLVNDWPDHAPGFIKKNIHRYGGFIQTSGSSDDVSRLSEEGCEDKTAQPSGFDSTPNQTKPNQTKEAAAARAAALDFSSLEGTGRVSAAFSALGTALVRCKSQLARDREWIWGHAAVAELVRPGWMLETAERIKAREVGKPKAYIEKTLREECKDSGTTLQALLQMVPELPPKPQRNESEELAACP